MKILDSFKLKIIAIICMSLDHVAFVFLSGTPYIICRFFGRLTFPIMALMLVNGFIHTKDLKKYLTRLFIFALVAQLPFYLVFKNGLNVLFTLFICLLILTLHKKMTDIVLKYTFIVILALILPICDWNIISLIIVLIFYLGKDNKKLLISLYLIFSLIFVIIYPYYYSFGILLFIPIYLLYNGNRGLGFKYFFYIYYPLHLFIIYFVSFLITI